MTKEEVIDMIRLVEYDLIQDVKHRSRDYYDGVRNIVSPDFSCCKLTEAIVGEDDFCSKGAR